MLAFCACCAGSIPEELGALTMLEMLSLKNNNLAGESPIVIRGRYTDGAMQASNAVAPISWSLPRERFLSLFRASSRFFSRILRWTLYKQNSPRQVFVSRRGRKAYIPSGVVDTMIANRFA